MSSEFVQVTQSPFCDHSGFPALLTPRPPPQFCPLVLAPLRVDPNPRRRLTLVFSGTGAMVPHLSGPTPT